MLILFCPVKLVRYNAPFIYKAYTDDLILLFQFSPSYKTAQINYVPQSGGKVPIVSSSYLNLLHELVSLQPAQEKGTEKV